jgi:two-component system, NarL family, sensor kinase
MRQPTAAHHRPVPPNGADLSSDTAPEHDAAERPASSFAAHRRRRSVQRVTAALLVSALAAFAIVASAAVIVAKRIARDDALAEAVRTAQNTAAVLFAPALSDVLRGDPVEADRLRAAVAERRAHGLIDRVKVWNANGVIVYSDSPAAVGRRFPVSSDVRGAVEHGTSSADVSDLEDPENVTEIGLAPRLVEVYTPLELPEGQRYALELYSDYSRVATAENRLVDRIVPFALLSLLVLVILQLPASFWLVRRVARASEERAMLLRRALTVSENERRGIARDLHDGVVQELAGVSYVLSSLTTRLPAGTDDDTAGLFSRLNGSVRNCVRALRTLMVEMYPPDLSMAGMYSALMHLAAPLRTAGIEVTVDVSAEAAATRVADDITAMLYRSARECIANISKHAHAESVWICLRRQQSTLELIVDDDGVGLPAGGIDRRGEGHLGLRLLFDAVAELGGHMTVSQRLPSGTHVALELPAIGYRPARGASASKGGG